MILTADIDGELLDFALPYAATEWPYSTVCDFRALDAAFLRLNRETNPEGGDGPTEAQQLAIYAALADSVAAVVGEVAYDLPLADTDGTAQPVDELIDRGYTVGFGDELTQLRLYAHLLTVLRRSGLYRSERAKDWTPATLPAKIDFDLNGQRYRIHRDAAARVLAGKDLTTGEAIEVKEYRRLSAERAKAIGPDGAAGDIAALDFTLGLTEVALLLRKPGERLPVDERARTQWLTQRREDLAEIDLATVMEVRHFMTAAVLRLAHSGATASGPTVRQLTPHQPAPARSKPRRKRPAKHRLKRPLP